tara:strand:+ start:4803 stop:5903 length:1101 start_codon:yes stop_codon:yes gene_type:complete
MGKTNGNTVIIAQLEDALENKRVDQRSIDFATSLVNQYKRKGRLSENQISWAIKLAKVPESRTDNPLINDLRKYVENLPDKSKGFANSMLKQYDNKGKLSWKQMNWVQKLTDEAKLAGGVPTGLETFSDYDAVVALFTESGKKLQVPTITLMVNEFTGLHDKTPYWSPYQKDLIIRGARKSQEDDNLLYVACVETSHQKFDIYGKPVTKSKTQQKENSYQWLGTIDKTTKIWTPTRKVFDDLNTDILATMEMFRLDPTDTIIRRGKSSGRCCFCNKHLNDEKSTAHGYGPTCARNYGLKYSKKSADEIMKQITSAVSRKVFQLRDGVWAVVDIDSGEVLGEYNDYDSAQSACDEGLDEVKFVEVTA